MEFRLSLSFSLSLSLPLSPSLSLPLSLSLSPSSSLSLCLSLSLSLSHSLSLPLLLSHSLSLHLYLFLPRASFLLSSTFVLSSVTAWTHDSQLGNGGEVTKYLQQIKDEELGSTQVQFAIKVWAALKSENTVKFFNLLRQANVLQASLMHRYVGQVRLTVSTHVCFIHNRSLFHIGYI